ncbi:MAG: hypothetical protein MCSN_0740 [Candidatus Microsyncoccus archaeolyticus]|nr:MAG: hypothetical protein MCSN_0740 [Candidatus Parcubacteria bacterium]
MIKKKLIFFCAVFVLSIIILIVNLKAEIIINDAVFDVKVLVFNSEKIKGLGGKQELKDNQGMLFVYLNEDKRYFWMKDMNFPIDVLWIRDNKIVNISENVPILTKGEITRINSLYNVDKVLEIKAGSVSKYNINIDDEIIIKLKTPF